MAFKRDAKPFVTICEYTPVFVAIASGVIPFFCLAIITVLYVLIYRNLKHKVFSHNFIDQNIWTQIFQYFKKFRNGMHENDEEKRAKKEVKTTIILFVTVTFALAIMIPSMIVFTLFQTFHLKESTFYLFVCLYLLHPIINPLLYVYNILSIRARAKKILQKLVPCKTEREIREKEKRNEV